MVDSRSRNALVAIGAAALLSLSALPVAAQDGDAPLGEEIGGGAADDAAADDDHVGAFRQGCFRVRVHGLALEPVLQVAKLSVVRGVQLQRRDGDVAGMGPVDVAVR